MGTRVTVHGTGFLIPSPGQLPATAEVEITFDDQSIGFIFLQNNQFDFTFNVPEAQSVEHQIHAIELFPEQINATASFTVTPEPGVLSLILSVGSIYFPGDTASISVMTSLNGKPVNVSTLKLFLMGPSRSNSTLTTTLVATGVYRATFTIPSTGSIGTYTVVARAHQPGAQDASSLTSFEVKLSWLSANGPKIAAGAIGAVGVVSLLGFVWKKGYLTRRKDEISLP